MTEIVATGETAASPRNPQIVDVPAFVPPVEDAKPKADEAPAATAADEGQSPEGVDAGKDADPEGDAKEAKKRNGYKEKLERERQRTAELQAALAATKNKAPEKPVEPEGKPTQRDDETYAEYYERLADWKLDEREKAKELKQREASLKTEFADKQKQYATKADEFKATTPDFDDVINSYDGPLTAPMQQALLDSDLGPQIAYYVAQHPEEGEAMAQMGVLALNKAIGRIEARLESSTVDTAPKPTPKVSKAPPPIDPVGKSAVTSSYDPHRSKGADDHAEYMKWRKQQK